jgi:hypothetical protein
MDNLTPEERAELKAWADEVGIYPIDSEVAEAWEHQQRIIDKLRDELDQLKSGALVLYPSSQQHADAMVRMGSCYGKTN